MRKLVWSDELASNAQKYANLCNTDPDALDTSGIRGRLINICSMTGSGFVIEPLNPQYNGSGRSHCGPNGDEYYHLADNFGNHPFGVPTTTDISTMVQQWASCSVDGGCKQFVWASTSKVGCGVKVCGSTRQNNADIYKMVFVCDYDPVEELGDQEPYEEGSPSCSKCDNHCPGPWRCESNLCVPQ